MIWTAPPDPVYEELTLADKYPLAGMIIDPAEYAGRMNGDPEWSGVPIGWPPSDYTQYFVDQKKLDKAYAAYHHERKTFSGYLGLCELRERMHPGHPSKHPPIMDELLARSDDCEKRHVQRRRAKAKGARIRRRRAAQGS